jgi:hypothetical protein
MKTVRGGSELVASLDTEQWPECAGSIAFVASAETFSSRGMPQSGQDWCSVSRFGLLDR